MSLELWLRLGCFFGVLLLMHQWELRRPARPIHPQQRQRYWHNLSLVAVSTLLLRLLIPAGAVGAAWWATNQQFGLRYWLEMPNWLAFALSLLLLDLLIYWQHRLFHTLPWLWRLHRVHHADPEFDSSTGLRFHPLEILLSMLLKMAAVVLLGAPIWAVIVFEIVLNASSIFNHANIRLPAGLERRLRYLIVTQDMHRIHHSQREAETNSNYAFNLSLWDRLFGSYCEQPYGGAEQLQIGLQEFPQREQTTHLMALLKLPFRDPK